MRPRKGSIVGQLHATHQPSQSVSRLRTLYDGDSATEDHGGAHGGERAPLLSSSTRMRSEPAVTYSALGSTEYRRDHPRSRRESSRASGRKDYFKNPPFTSGGHDHYDVNYPPSMPGSPRLGAMDRDMRFEDAAMLMDEASSPHEGSFMDDMFRSPSSPMKPSTPFERRNTFDSQVQGDVCFPQEGMSELADDELREMREQRMRSRRRKKRWPVLSVFDEWSRAEKEGRSEERRAKMMKEPQLVNGRLRPIHKGWFQPEEDAPYRFTYFNEEFQSTIHSSTISELVQPEGQGGSFRELFVPDRPIVEDSSESESEEDDLQHHAASHAASIRHSLNGRNGDSKAPTRQVSLATPQASSEVAVDEMLSPKAAHEGSRISQQDSGQATPSHPTSATSPMPFDGEKPVRYGERPVWWLDVLSPTSEEMHVLRRAFGIHPLTVEDIMLQESREKVELFKNYYFINYRTFNQDVTSEDYLEPIDFYVVVFREGVLSFHFSPTPHSANVRRRIRMLRDFMVLSSDWISYAIIDDITDVYAPLIQNIEEEVDDIDAAIVRLHSEEEPTKGEKATYDGSRSEAGATTFDSGGDMYRRVGECRKKVMGLYRLLGNKADVIKGFAKRCNERWEVAPRSEIGLFLGDIQDHIVTMTGNLSHYEK